MRSNRATAEKEIAGATVVAAIDEVVGGSQLTEFRYLTYYLTKKYGMLEEGVGDHRGIYWLTGTDLDE